MKPKNRKPNPYFADEVIGKYEFCFSCFFKHDPAKDCLDKSGWIKPEIGTTNEVPKKP